MSDRAHSDARIFSAVQHALAVSERTAHAELNRGMRTLGTIASTAPLVGLFGTVIGIVYAFKGCGAPVWVCYTATLNGLCEALVSTALGLAVAVPACWAYDYFHGRLERFDVEAVGASSELATYLAVRMSKQRDAR